MGPARSTNERSEYIAAIDNTRGGADMHGPRIGKEKNHGDFSVHAPN